MLNPKQFRELCGFLVPHMDKDRRPNIRMAFYGEELENQIDWEGPNHEFTANMLRKVLNFGMLTTGELAVVEMLRALRGQLGVDKQQEIDAWINIIEDTSRRSTEDVLASKTREEWVDNYLNRIRKVQFDVDIQALTWKAEEERFVTDTSQPGNIDISEHFKQQRRLLILGEAGAGKTVYLSRIAEYVLKGNLNDWKQVPVVLLLRSWQAGDFESLKAWIIYEIMRKYGVDAEAELENEKLVLLLDGLDEIVDIVERRKCYDAIIQHFYEDYPTAEFAITCRKTEFAEIFEQEESKSQSIESGIEVLRLNIIQARKELYRGNYTKLQRVMTTEPWLSEMITNPFLLQSILLAYRDDSIGNLKVLPSQEKRQEHLFNSYVRARMSIDPSEQNNKITLSAARQYWFPWIASRFEKGFVDESEFYLEEIQPYWLADDNDLIPPWLRKRKISNPVSQEQLSEEADAKTDDADESESEKTSVAYSNQTVREYYEALIQVDGFREYARWVRLTCASVGGMSAGLSIGIFNTWQTGLAGTIAGIVVCGLSFTIAGEFLPRYGIEHGLPPYIIKTRKEVMVNNLAGTNLGDFIRLGISLLSAVVIALLFNIGSAIIFFFAFLFNAGIPSRPEIEIAAFLTPSYKSIKYGVLTGLKFGIVVSFISGLLLGWITSTTYEIDLLPISILVMTLVFIVVFVLSIGMALLSPTKNENKKRVLPNQDIGESVSTIGWVLGVTFIIFFILISGVLSTTLIFFPEIKIAVQQENILFLSSPFRIGFFGAGAISLSLGLKYGLRGILKHYSLRFVLSKQKKFPLRYGREFLIYASQVFLLRRVGGGVIFQHVNLEKFFSSNYKTK
jgi:hypothetical protein